MKKKFNFSNWQNIEIHEEVLVSEWKSCSINKEMNEMFSSIVENEKIELSSCSSGFSKELLNPNNFYSFVYLNELEYYFLSYNPFEGKLYYIRKRGF